MRRKDVLIVAHGSKPWYKTPLVLVPFVLAFCIFSICVAVILYKKRKAAKGESAKDIEKANQNDKPSSQNARGKEEKKKKGKE